MFCVLRMNVLFTKFLREQATEDTGTQIRSFSMIFLSLNLSDLYAFTG